MRFLITAILVVLVSIPAYGEVIMPSSVVMQDEYVFHRESSDSNSAFYDYAPEAILENGIYHLYWCGGVAGDFILHAQSSSLAGPYHSSTSNNPNSYDVSLFPTGDQSFDGAHTCDPSVIKVGDFYYLYYGGLGPANLTAIGVASSTDGIHFTRLNGGRAIVDAAMTSSAPINKYGAGQPSVLYRAPFYYMAFTDTTGSGVNPLNGAGQFLLRSPDPVFQHSIEEFTENGWEPRAPGVHTAQYSFLEAFSIDWTYDVISQKFLVGSHQDFSQTYIYILDSSTFETLGALSVPGTWRDGPSLLKNPDHSSLPRRNCRSMELSVFKGDSRSSVYLDFGSWDISLSDAIFDLPSAWCNAFE